MLDKYKKSENMKKKWIKTLDNLPQGVVVYDQQKDSIDFMSKALKHIFREEDL